MLPMSSTGYSSSNQEAVISGDIRDLKVYQTETGWKGRWERNFKLSFTKWRGRNFVGFVEFPSFPLTYMQKKLCCGSEVIRSCLGVCASVCLSLQKSAITFDSLEWPARTFQGPLNSSQVIFAARGGMLFSQSKNAPLLNFYVWWSPFKTSLHLRRHSHGSFYLHPVFLMISAATNQIRAACFLQKEELAAAGLEPRTSVALSIAVVVLDISHSYQELVQLRLNLMFNVSSFHLKK